MFKFLLEADKYLFFFINGLNSPFFDTVMSIISHKYTWIPLYFIILLLLIKHYKWKSVSAVLFIILLIVATDQSSVHLFKNVFQRLRPCHNPEFFNLVHLVNNKCGGLYGFVSSHAANTAGLATYVILIFNQKRIFYVIPIMLAYTFLNSYSRVYLGVHYPSDVFVGTLLGVLCGFFFAWILKKTDCSTCLKG